MRWLDKGLIKMILNKKVAICIPAYNDPNSLKKLLDSICNQIFTDYFVIISDDSTNSAVQKLIEVYQEQIPLIYKKNPIPLGPTANTNNAIRMANKHCYEYLKIMHHDDYFTYDYSLQKFVAMLDDNPNASLAFSGSVQIMNEDSYKRSITNEQLLLIRNDYRSLVKGNYIGAPSATIVRKTHVLMDENLIWDVDWEWYVRILKINNVFNYTKLPLVTIVMSDMQMTHFCQQNQELMLRETLYTLKKNAFLHEAYSSVIIERLLSYVKKHEVLKKTLFIYGAGKLGKECADILNANGIPFKGYIVSRKLDSKKNNNKPVFSIDEIIAHYNKNNITIILAMKNEYIKEVLKNLKSKKYYNYNNICGLGEIKYWLEG